MTLTCDYRGVPVIPDTNGVDVFMSDVILGTMFDFIYHRDVFFALYPLQN